MRRRRRVAALAWLAMTVVVWNTVYDLLLTRAGKEYLLRHALHEAGRGPRVSIDAVMVPSVYDAIWKSTLAAGIVLLAALLTIRYLTAPTRRGS